MDRISVPWFLTPGQKGNQLADTLDSYVNAFPFGRNFSPNTFYSANASVRYDAAQDKSVSAKNSLLADSIDNSGLYDEDPATRALRLARDGTSSRYACNTASPFHAPFAKIERQRQVENDYFWAGCIRPTYVLVIFFILLQLGVSLGALSYYINDLPNPCSAIVFGALLEWEHGNVLNRMATLPPIAPVLPAPLFAVAPPPPIVQQQAARTATVIDVPPNPLALFVAKLFGNAQEGNAPLTLESRNAYTGGVTASACNVLTSGMQSCYNQWSIPSAEWVGADPNAAKFVFRGCLGATCASKSGVPSVGTGVCTCPMPAELRRQNI